mmetsp:Transcript_6612/g.16889  ORF Transcript_6612/g.16889 Transcript_6612/m.16889 type:complete len:254 (+) Transcript_6612:98-859(+)
MRQARGARVRWRGRRCARRQRCRGGRGARGTGPRQNQLPRPASASTCTPPTPSWNRRTGPPMGPSCRQLMAPLAWRTAPARSRPRGRSSRWPTPPSGRVRAPAHAPARRPSSAGPSTTWRRTRAARSSGGPRRPGSRRHLRHHHHRRRRHQRPPLDQHLRRRRRHQSLPLDQRLRPHRRLRRLPLGPKRLQSAQPDAQSRLPGCSRRPHRETPTFPPCPLRTSRPASPRFARHGLRTGAPQTAPARRWTPTQP